MFANFVNGLGAHGLAAAQGGDVDARVGADGGQRQHDAVARGRAALELKTVDGFDEVFAALRGQLGQLGAAGKRHDAHTHMAGQLGDEGLGGVLRSSEAVGLHIGGAHAARDIHGQHDGLVLRGQGDDGKRA